MRRRRVIGPGFPYLVTPVAAGGGGAWTPANFGANLVAWYKADAGVSTSGGKVTTVTDQAAAMHAGNYDLAAAGGTTGVVVNATGINSHPAFECVFANNITLDAGLKTANEVVNIGTFLFTIYMVLTLRNLTNSNGAVLSFKDNTDGDYNQSPNIRINRSGTADAMSFYKDGAEFGIGAVTVGTPFRYGVVMSASSLLTAYLNGAPTGTPKTVATGPMATAGTLALGAILGGTSPPSFFPAFDGFIGEVVITNANNTAEVTAGTGQLDNYFKTRFGL